MNPEISFFLTSLVGGGAEKCTLILAEGFARKGFRVDLVVAKAEGAFANLVPGQIRLVDLRAKTVWNSIPSLIRYLQTERPEALISSLDHANVAALAARRVAGVDLQLIVSTHTMVSLSLHSTVRVTAQVLPILIRVLYPTANQVLAVSDAVAHDLASIARLPRSAVRVVYNPVPIHEIQVLSRETPECDMFGEGSPPVVIAVGSLLPHKDHETLVEAFGIVRRHRPTSLAILGEGSERTRLENRVRGLGLEKDVRMPGFVQNPYAWMARSAVLVLPSRWEGFGRVLIEGMACGITPVATSCPGGPAEVLDNGRYGYLTPVGDVDAMATTILKSLDLPLDPNSLRRRAEAFSAERIVERYMELLGK